MLYSLYFTFSNDFEFIGWEFVGIHDLGSCNLMNIFSSLCCQQLVSIIEYYIIQGEELIILYANAIVVIDGLSLFMALKACRNQIAKGNYVMVFHTLS